MTQQQQSGFGGNRDSDVGADDAQVNEAGQTGFDEILDGGHIQMPPDFVPRVELSLPPDGTTVAAWNPAASPMLPAYANEADRSEAARTIDLQELPGDTVEIDEVLEARPEDVLAATLQILEVRSPGLWTAVRAMFVLPDYMTDGGDADRVTQMYQANAELVDTALWLIGTQVAAAQAVSEPSAARVLGICEHFLRHGLIVNDQTQTIEAFVAAVRQQLQS